MEDLQSLILKIVEESKKLKDNYTDGKEAPVDFTCIFCQTEDEYIFYTKEVAKLGNIIQNTPAGFTYLLEKPISTSAGKLYLVKIRKPDPARRELGDADFSTDYKSFKEKYSKQPGFELVTRNDFEMLRLSDEKNKVMACFPNIPLSELLRIH